MHKRDTTSDDSRRHNVQLKHPSARQGRFKRTEGPKASRTQVRKRRVHPNLPTHTQYKRADTDQVNRSTLLSYVRTYTPAPRRGSIALHAWVGPAAYRTQRSSAPFGLRLELFRSLLPFDLGEIEIPEAVNPEIESRRRAAIFRPRLKRGPRLPVSPSERKAASVERFVGALFEVGRTPKLSFRAGVRPVRDRGARRRRSRARNALENALSLEASNMDESAAVLEEPLMTLRLGWLSRQPESRVGGVGLLDGSAGSRKWTTGPAESGSVGGGGLLRPAPVPNSRFPRSADLEIGPRRDPRPEKRQTKKLLRKTNGKT